MFKGIALLSLLLPSLTYAQFSGGNGRGDVVSDASVSFYGENMYYGGVGRGDDDFTLNGSLLDASVMYHGGAGRGDSVLTRLSIMLSESFMYSGGTGRGDSTFTVPNIMLSDNLMYAGGTGRGDDLLTRTDIMLADNLMYVGSTGRGDDVITRTDLMLTDNLMYVGSTGRGDDVLTRTDLMLTDNLMYVGSTGRGDDVITRTDLMLADNLMYVGSTGRGDDALTRTDLMLTDNLMYVGSTGRGDDVLTRTDLMLTDNLMYVGSIGRGDEALTRTDLMLTDNLMYVGSTGRGDDVLTGTDLMLTDNLMYLGSTGRGDEQMTITSQMLEPNLMYRGSTGRGDVVSATLTRVVSGKVLWRGGQVATRETDWNQAGNWYPAVIPGTGDDIAIENNGNGYELTLDKNRWINSLDFNGAGKDVILGNNNLVIAGGETSGAGASSYLKTNGTGCVRMPIPSGQSRFFPIGNSTYNPITITNNTGTQDSFCARVVDEVYLRGLTGNPAYNIPRVKRSWVIEKSSGNSNAGSGVNFQFNWNFGEDSAVVNMVMYYWDGNNWVKFTNGSSNLYQYNYTAYKGNFGIFALGDDLSTLPVSWLYMYCKRLTEQSVMLNWGTGMEQNSKEFVIQRKTGSSQYTDIARVASAGNSYEPMHYRFIDQQAPATATQYRIKQIDADGTESFSSICVSNAAGYDEQNILVMPVPADRELHVALQGFNEAFKCTLIDASGKVVLQTESSQSATTLPTHNLAPGIYILQLSAPGLLKYEKVLINHP